MNMYNKPEYADDRFDGSKYLTSVPLPELTGDTESHVTDIEATTIAVQSLRVTGQGELCMPRLDGDVGYNLTIRDRQVIMVDQLAVVRHYISIQLPTGMAGLILPRSIANVKGLLIHASVIDNGFRGELTTLVRNMSGVPQVLVTGQAISQLVMIPMLVPAVEWVKDLEPSTRGTAGFGSTGS